jgi:selT/selW/selH-like putative selenoprotein
LADTLREHHPGTQVELIRSGGGVFEIVVDGRLVYSKMATGRHCTHEEILEAIAGD